MVAGSEHAARRSPGTSARRCGSSPSRAATSLAGAGAAVELAGAVLAVAALERGAWRCRWRARRHYRGAGERGRGARTAPASPARRRCGGSPQAQNYTFLWRMTSCMQSLKMSRISAIRRIVVK
jgi:hypothetical protein